MKRFFALLNMTLFCAVISANISENEPNNDFEHSQQVDVNTTVNASLGYVVNETTDQYDYYAIQLPDDGVLTVTTCSDASLRLGNLVVSTWADGTFKERGYKDMDGYGEEGRKESWIINDMKAGTYYFKLEHYRGEGNYTIFFQFTASPYANDKEPNDDFSQAQPIALGQDMEGHLGFHNNTLKNNDIDTYDWYRIDLPADGTLDIQTTTETALRLDYLHIGILKDGDFLSRNNKDMDANEKDTTITFTISDLAKGTYYIRLKQYRGVGGYVLNCRFTQSPYANDEEPNNEIAQAQAIPCGQNIQGHLGYFNYQDNDEYDFFRIDLPADGTLNIQTTTETTLRLDYLHIGILKDGDFLSRNNKDMDAYEKDTTITFTIPDLAKGAYYVRVKRYRGFGGYLLNCAFTPNPFYTNDDLYTQENPCPLTLNKTDYTTLGYKHYNDAKEKVWYSFSTSAPTTLEIQPDTTKTLVLGVVEIWKKNADGSLKSIYGERLERTYRSFEISEAGDYLVCIPRYSGYGGISVRYGEDESGTVESNSPIRVSVEGRNTVRKGVPCQNTIVVRNTSDKKTGSFFLAMANTDDIRINKINLSDINGRYGEDMMYEEICNSDSSVVLYIPSLAPFEEYKILVTSEGVGDIDYVKAENGRKEAVVTATFLAVAAIGFAADACVDAAGDWLKGKVKEKIGELSENEAEAYRRCMGLTRQQYEETKYNADGYGACVAKKAIENTMKGVMKAVPGGSTAMNIGEKLAESADIITCMRRKLWYWIYKDIGLIPSDNTHIYNAKVGVNGVVASWDPNEMVGPQGFGDEHYIGELKTINYTIMFENKAEAGAPAYRVRVFDELDPNVFDINSVRFGSTSHDGMGYNWKMSCDGNKLSWDIEGIELPPNKVAPEGEGYVTFSVNLQPGLSDGAQIANKATIIFDKNTPIETNVFTNTLDLEAPNTTMLSAEKSDEGILVKCLTTDTKSGVEAYAFYVSKDKGDFELVGYYPGEEILYTPTGDGEYDFYVLAVDHVGNAETTIPNSVSITTDVKQVPIDILPADGTIYDLQGRKVQHQHHGIYIQNGRKILK